MADLFDPPAEPRADPPETPTIREAARPFVRWLEHLDRHFGTHQDEILVAGFQGAGITFGDLRRLRRAVEADAGERDVAELRRENSRLRALLARSDQPCPYCGLAAEDMAKCAYGFPGCSRADDWLIGMDLVEGSDALPKP